ncbi:hypothetical protein [Deinococcus aquiradiocola]|uniref:hypothetical protein n=1 Tax=Deinococcus aquiradiocola TaxID=393059 RepID=UPI00166CD846|nr:hypothetical protein [Deinococcus aquiradiocola]
MSGAKTTGQDEAREGAPAGSPPSPRIRRVPVWAVVLLNVLLPGSGQSLLGRADRHLLTLALTLLDWWAAWAVTMHVSVTGLAERTPALAAALVLLAALLVLASYALLTVTALRASPSRRGVPVWRRAWPALLHACAFGWLLTQYPPWLPA